MAGRAGFDVELLKRFQTAWKLTKAWPEAVFEIIWDASLASTEPGVIDALQRANDAAARL